MHNARYVECPGRDALADARKSIRKTDMVVLPAHNEALYIGGVIAYLRSMGFASSQIMVIDSHSTDGTAEAAIAAGVPAANVVDEVNIFRTMLPCGLSISAFMAVEYGVPPDRIRGKGAAVYAGLVTLGMRRWFDSDGRLFLLDADLIHAERSDPIGSLLYALEHEPEAKYLKCAMYHMGADGVDAILAGVPHPQYFFTYMSLQALLGGQVAFRDLRMLATMKVPTSYGLELACHLQAIDRHGPSGVALVNIPESLQHDVGTLAGYTVMDMQLVEFMSRIANRRQPLIAYDREQIRAHNAHFRDLVVSAENGTERASGRMDMLLPAVWEILTKLRETQSEAMSDSPSGVPNGYDA